MTKNEETLVLIKPDGVKRKLMGNIISRFENRGLDIKKCQLMTLSKEKAAEHYKEHVGKPFFDPLLEFITSSPLMAMVITGERAVEIVRKMCGTTDSAAAEPGSIRGDYSISKSQNIVHSSDSVDSAKREIKIFFGS